MRRVLAPRILAALIFLGFVLSWSQFADPGSRQHAPANVAIERVVDGDTVVLTGIGAKRETVRLIGVDTPETKHPTKPVECYGPEASAFTKRLLPKGTAAVAKFDADAPERDRYGRLLVYLWLNDDTMVNLELIRRGYARASYFRPHDDYRRLFKATEAKAKDAGKGRWKACQR
jgi:micrococcal nuclease